MVSLFAGLNDIELSSLEQSSKLRSYKQNEIVINEGDNGNSLYIILEGAAQVFIEQDGTKKFLACLEKGDYFGEISLIDNEPRSVTVITTKKTHVIKITRASFRKVLNRHRNLVLYLIKHLTKTVRTLNKS